MGNIQHYARAMKTIDKRQLRLHHVDFLAFTARYARKDAQVYADMRLVAKKKKVVKVNQGGGYGLEVPCQYSFKGNSLAVKWLSEHIAKERKRNQERNTSSKRKQ